MIKINDKKLAFSLVELSIVILIIGILIAGITQSSTLIKKSKLSNAKHLTQISPVTSIKGLFVWYETTMPTSFDNLDDGESVATWYDSDVRISNHINATQSTSTRQPKFYENVFNGAIPAVRFDGSNYLDFDGSGLVNTDYTIFIVEQRRAANSGHSPIIGGTGSTSYQNLHITYSSNTNIRFSHYGTGTSLDITVDGYTKPIPKMHTFIFSQVDGKQYWLNGGTSNDESASGSNQEVALSSFDGAAIGKYTTNYFNGDIAEIIIFNKALNNEDRQDIEDYLSKKYSIGIN